MTRIMRDSTSPGDIPTDGTQLVAGYINGNYAWTQAGWDRFTVPHITIDVNGTRPDADVLDVEAGDATVDTAVRWVQQKRNMPADYFPVIYCDRSTLPPLFSAMAESGLYPGHHFGLWVATLDGTKDFNGIPGLAAIQYAGEDLTGGHYDESQVYDDKWKPTSPSFPPWSGEYLKLQTPMLHDDNVHTWQAIMGGRGWRITVDGWYGPESAAVCRAFQQEKGLQVDGIVGPETWAATWTAPRT